jgi:Protein of unknown function (DUF2862)
MEIGQKVKIRRLRDRVSQDVVGRLGKFGLVQDFKVLDGNMLGVIVQFDDQFTTWFFEDEVEAAS